MPANFTFSTPAYYVDELTGAFGFTVTVLGTSDTTGTFSVNYATSDFLIDDPAFAEAIAGIDYQATAGTFTFNLEAGAIAAQTFTIFTIDNGNAEINPSRALNLTLSDPVLGLLQTATLNIDDDDFQGVRDYGHGSSTTQYESSDQSPTDYAYPFDSTWQENFDGPWFAQATVQFAQETPGATTTLPFQIIDNDNSLEGSETVIWEIGANAPYGFSSATYTFSESEANNPRGGIVDIELAFGSPIKTATIAIEDDDIQPSITTFSSTDSPQPINDLSTTTSDLVVGGLAGALVDVDVTLDITHTWDADLDVFLISPTGTRVELAQDVGSSGNNFTNTTFDDEALTSISLGAAPFTGSFQPQGFLATFDGQDPNGTWQLEVTDDAGLDIGTLNSWSLTLTV